MANFFSISVAPEIAAVEAKVDIIDTEVDAIRATDLPGIDTKIDTVNTVVDAIRATDVPNIQTNIDANETKIDTIDTEVDAIRAVDVVAIMTALAGIKPRGQLKQAGGLQIWNGYQEVLNETGSGKLFVLGGSQAVGAGLMRLTLDGVVYNSGAIAAAVSYWRLGVIADDIALICDPGDPFVILNVEWDTSLVLDLNSQSGVNGLAWHIIYILT